MGIDATGDDTESNGKCGNLLTLLGVLDCQGNFEHAGTTLSVDFLLEDGAGPGLSAHDSRDCVVTRGVLGSHFTRQESA